MRGRDVALSVLFAAAASEADTAVQPGLVVTGVLSLIGLVGPAVDRIAWRGVGILGYAVVFLLTCVPLKAPGVVKVALQWRSNSHRAGLGGPFSQLGLPRLLGRFY